VRWAALDDIIEGIFSGQLQNPSLVVGALSLRTAIHEARIDQLRPGNSPWEARVVPATRQ
jgi:hypothetical protein